MSEQHPSETTAPRRPKISNPKTIQDMEWMKQRLGLTTDAELLSVALSTLKICIQLQDKGYVIGGFTEKDAFGEREYRTITLDTIR